MKYIDWYGDDESPCTPDSRVNIMTRNGNWYTDEIAGDWRWSHFKDVMDIVKYAVVKVTKD